MGAGKTTVGNRLADNLGLPFFDLDAEIEQLVGMTVREIFETLGEPGFRSLEHESLRALCQRPRLVAATGGGTLTHSASQELIGRSGLTVWLHPPFSAIVERIGGVGKEDRPLFRDEVQAWHLYRQRLPTYRRCDLRVDVDAGEQAEEVAARIALMIRKHTLCDI